MRVLAGPAERGCWIRRGSQRSQKAKETLSLRDEAQISDGGAGEEGLVDGRGDGAEAVAGPAEDDGVDLG